MSDPTKSQIKAAAITFMDALRQEFMIANPGMAPATRPLRDYDPLNQGVILRATKRMLQAAANAAAAEKPAPNAHHRFRTEGEST